MYYKPTNTLFVPQTVRVADSNPNLDLPKNHSKSDFYSQIIKIKFLDVEMVKF